MASTRRALLIGSPYGGLEGPKNDVRIMRKSLEAYRFTSTICCGPEATRDNILAAWERLIDQALPGDVVVIYYSGHGGLLDLGDSKDPTLGEEDKRQFQYIVPYDFDPSAEDCFKGILDIELSTLLQRTTDKTENVTVITDCCYAARLVRDPRYGGNLKPVIRNVRDPIRVKDSRIISDHLRQQRNKGQLNKDLSIGGNPYAVRVAATTATNSAFGYEGKEGTQVGVFTEKLAEALDKLHGRQNISWRTLLLGIESAIKQLFPSQHPRAQGPHKRLLFETKEVTSDLLTATKNGADIMLSRGRISGIQEGSIFDIMPLGEERVDSGKRLAEVKVSTVGSFEAVAEIIWKAERREAPGSTIRIREGDCMLAFLKKIGLSKVPISIPDIPDVKTQVSSSKFLRSGRQEDGDVKIQIKEEYLPKGGPSFVVYNKGFIVGRHTITPNRRDRAIFNAIKDGERLARADHFLSIQSTEEEEALGDCIDVRFGVVINPKGNVDQQKLLLQNGTDEISEGEKIYIRVENTSEERIYINILCVNMAGRIKMILSGGGRGLPLSPHSAKTVGKASVNGQMKGLELFWPEGVPRTKPIEETIVLVASSEEVDFRHLQDSTGQSTVARDSSASPPSSLQAIIQQLSTAQSRDVQPDCSACIRYKIHHIPYTLKPREEMEDGVICSRNQDRVVGERLQTQGETKDSYMERLASKAHTNLQSASSGQDQDSEPENKDKELSISNAGSVTNLTNIGEHPQFADALGEHKDPMPSEENELHGIGINTTSPSLHHQIPASILKKYMEFGLNGAAAGTFFSIAKNIFSHLEQREGLLTLREFSTRFACPFAKIRPGSYTQCLAINAKSLVGIKAHIQKCHQISEALLDASTSWAECLSRCFPDLDPSYQASPYFTFVPLMFYGQKVNMASCRPMGENNLASLSQNLCETSFGVSAVPQKAYGGDMGQDLHSNQNTLPDDEQIYNILSETQRWLSLSSDRAEAGCIDTSNQTDVNFDISEGSSVTQALYFLSILIILKETWYELSRLRASSLEPSSPVQATRSNYVSRGTGGDGCRSSQGSSFEPMGSATQSSLSRVRKSGNPRKRDNRSLVKSSKAEATEKELLVHKYSCPCAILKCEKHRSCWESRKKYAGTVPLLRLHIGRTHYGGNPPALLLRENSPTWESLFEACSQLCGKPWTESKPNYSVYVPLGKISTVYEEVDARKRVKLGVAVFQKGMHPTGDPEPGSTTALEQASPKVPQPHGETDPLSTEFPQLPNSYTEVIDTQDIAIMGVPENFGTYCSMFGQSVSEDTIISTLHDMDIEASLYQDTATEYAPSLANNSAHSDHFSNHSGFGTASPVPLYPFPQDTFQSTHIYQTQLGQRNYSSDARSSLGDDTLEPYYQPSCTRSPAISNPLSPTSSSSIAGSKEYYVSPDWYEDPPSESDQRGHIRIGFLGLDDVAHRLLSELQKRFKDPLFTWSRFRLRLSERNKSFRDENEVINYLRFCNRELICYVVEVPQPSNSMCAMN
ncbi:hypothetical protein ABW19_dt0205185 [Dactylella cylindrospora]|nr:hypothetical protein ABW19_dt0205185 [Dactylella cylindrospora]